jgi:enediyne biosynthesis thioesterase
LSPTFDLSRLITFGETNLVGNVYFAHYLGWQGECRERFIAMHAPGLLDQLRDGLALVTVDCACDFFAELYALDTVCIRMSLASMEGNRIAMRFDYYRANETPPRLAARGRQTVAVMRRGPGGMVPAPIPTELAAALTAYEDVGS